LHDLDIRLLYNRFLFSTRNLGVFFDFDGKFFLFEVFSSKFRKFIWIKNNSNIPYPLVISGFHQRGVRDEKNK